MRILNSNDDSPYSGPFGDYLRLQAEFQTRLTDETIKYLQRLQQLAVPATPGSFIVPNAAGERRVSGRQGSTVTIDVELENRQRVYTVVTALLTPLTSAEGVTWFPAAQPEPAQRLIAPDQVVGLALSVAIPDELPAGEYHGVLSLLGFSGDAVAVVIECVARADDAEPKSPASRRRR